MRIAKFYLEYVQCFFSFFFWLGRLFSAGGLRAGNEKRWVYIVEFEGGGGGRCMENCGVGVLCYVFSSSRGIGVILFVRSVCLDFQQKNIRVKWKAFKYIMRGDVFTCGILIY